MKPDPHHLRPRSAVRGESGARPGGAGGRRRPRLGAARRSRSSGRRLRQRRGAAHDFKPGTLTDPTALPAGDYDLKVVAAGDGPDGKAIIEADGVGVPAGANITVVAHLDESGKPGLTPYVNDTSQVAAGQARLTVRHDAAAPAVDVRAGGTRCSPTW